MKDSHTTAEVRAAIQRAYKSFDKSGKDWAGTIMDELNKPKYRYDLPVMYDGPSVPELSRVGWLPKGAIRVRPLIETERVVEMIDECFSHREMALYSHEFRAAMTTKIATYSQESPDV